MPSSQFAPLAAAALCATPLGSLQPSMVQGLLSLMTSGLPATQPVLRLAAAFCGLQLSTPLHTSASLQRPLFGFFTLRSVPSSQLPMVQVNPSSTDGATPDGQRPGPPAAQP